MPELFDPNDSAAAAADVTGAALIMTMAEMDGRQKKQNKEECAMVLLLLSGGAQYVFLCYLYLPLHRPVCLFLTL